MVACSYFKKHEIVDFLRNSEGQNNKKKNNYCILHSSICKYGSYLLHILDLQFSLNYKPLKAQGKGISTASKGWSPVVTCCHSAKTYLCLLFACQKKSVMKCSVTALLKISGGGIYCKGGKQLNCSGEDEEEAKVLLLLALLPLTQLE